MGVEKRLRGEGLLDDGVGSAEEKESGPAAADATGELADEQRAAAVHGREDDEQREPCGGEISEEKFGNDGREEEERDGGGYGAIWLGCERVGHVRLNSS